MSFHYCIPCPACGDGCGPCGLCACRRDPRPKSYGVGDDLCSELQVVQPAIYTALELSSFSVEVRLDSDYDDPQRPETD